MRYLIALLILLASAIGFAEVTLTSGVNSNVQCKEAEWPATSLTMTVTTDMAATCKYDTSDVAYASMANTMESTGGTTHTQAFSQTCKNSYTYYVSCSADGVTFDAIWTIDADPPPQKNIDVR